MVWPAIAMAAGSIISSQMAASSQADANRQNVALEASSQQNQRGMDQYSAAAGNEMAESKRIYSEGQLAPYTGAGADAIAQQKALLGLSGPSGYSQALSKFNESPGQVYLREQEEKSVLRNAAATGGLRGGRVKEALQEKAFRRAQTDYGNYFNRLSGLRDVGGQASGQLAAQYRGKTETAVPDYVPANMPKSRGGGVIGNVVSGFTSALGGGK